VIFAVGGPAADDLLLLQLLLLLMQDEDVVMPLAMCRLLLGDAAGALSVLEDAERQKPPGGLPAAAAGSSGGGGLGSEPMAAHAVMQFVRTLSPQVRDACLLSGAQAHCWGVGRVVRVLLHERGLAVAIPPGLSA
jgi:hypothetical protein